MLTKGDISLVPLDKFNWEEVIHLSVAPDQAEFIPENLFSIAQSKFDQSTPYAIQINEEIVGMLMIRSWAGICWISRIMVDRNFQQRGIGSKALSIILRYLESKRDCHEIRTSVSRENIWGQYLFSSQDFEPIGEDELEVIFRHQKKSK